MTHLHSDRCLELGPLLYTIWVSSPNATYACSGPPGTRHLVDTFFAARSYDIEMRMADERQKDPSDMFLIEEFDEGAVFEDGNVSVTALQVVHPPLTLNVLLSFAQFEREVTAERIQDKIAAS